MASPSENTLKRFIGEIHCRRLWQVPGVERSVAVLPFVNMSGDADNEYFSDGITEELLNALPQLPDLRAPSTGTASECSS